MRLIDFIHSMSLICTMTLIFCALNEPKVNEAYLVMAAGFSLVAIGINIYDLSNT